MKKMLDTISSLKEMIVEVGENKELCLVWYVPIIPRIWEVEAWRSEFKPSLSYVMSLKIT